MGFPEVINSMAHFSGAFACTGSLSIFRSVNCQIRNFTLNYNFG